MGQTERPTVPPEPARRVTHPTLAAYRYLTQALRDGRFQAGARLPSERELSAELGVSRATVRQVLQALAEEGLLNAVPQRGWFVPEAVLTEPNVLLSFTELARAQGRTPEVRLLRSEVRTASLEEADRLGVAPTSPIREVERLRFLDGAPVCLEVNRLPLARVPELRDNELTTSIYAALAEESGRQVTRAEFVVQAGPADERTAEYLDAAAGTPVLVGDERTFDQNGEAVLLGRITYRWEAYRFEATLFRGREHMT